MIIYSGETCPRTYDSHITMDTHQQSSSNTVCIGDTGFNYLRNGQKIRCTLDENVHADHKRDKGNINIKYRNEIQ